MSDLFKDGFTADDFAKMGGAYSSGEFNYMASIANGILRQALEQAQRVYSSDAENWYPTHDEEYDTHTAKLVAINRIKTAGGIEGDET